MTREEQLEIIRAACGKAGGRTYENGCGLTDVLLAINPYTPRRHINAAAVEVLKHWRFETDDLREQSDECIAFLADLLANPNNHD